MGFFDNRAVNRIYVHATLATLADSTGGVFIFVFLLKTGFGLAIVYCTMAAWAILRIGLRRFVLPAVLRFGLRNCLVFGCLVNALAFLVLAGISRPGPLLLAYVFCFSMGNCFYWTCYHAVVAMVGDADKRGSQVSLRAALEALTGIIGPLIGAFLLVHFGSLSAFAFAALLSLLGILPLLSYRDLKIAPEANLDPVAKSQVWRIYFTDGLRAASNFFIWSIALFQALGENFSAFGAVLAMAGFAGAAMSLGIGRLIDIGHMARARQIAFIVMGASVAFKTVGFATPWMAIAASALGAMALPIYASVMMARVYNLAQASACPLRFHAVGEGAWDLGVAIGCLFAAGCTLLGFGFFWPLGLGILACALGYAAMADNRPTSTP